MNFFTKPYVVIIGAVGSGKTTLTEKLKAKKGLGVSHFGKSATRRTKVFDIGPFLVADTPGYMAMFDKLDHAVNIIRALEYRPVSRIFIMTKFDARLDNLLRGAMDVVRPLYQRRNAVTVVVTAWDLSDDTPQQQNAIRKVLESEIGISSVLFVGHQTERAELVELMQGTFLANPAKLEIPAAQIPRYFDIKKNDLAMMDFLKEKTGEYTEVIADIAEQVNVIADKDEQGDLAFYAQVALQELMEQMKEELIYEFDLKEDKPEEYAFLDQMHVELNTLLKCYRGFCRKFDNFSGGVANPFRKCPHCGEVWTRVEGCEGATTCGNRPVAHPSDGFAKRVWSWSFYKSDKPGKRGKICFLKTFLSSAVARIKKAAPRGEVVPAGCGKKIEWRNMQTVPIPVDLLDWVNYVTSAKETAVTTNERAVQELERRKLEAPPVLLDQDLQIPENRALTTRDTAPTSRLNIFVKKLTECLTVFEGS